MKSDVERIAALEVKVEAMSEAIKESHKKLDELLAFRNKGMGAFWLASALFGTSIVGFLSTVMNWIRT